MIIWIRSSYPKKAESYLGQKHRSLLSSYLYTDDGIFNFGYLLKKILFKHQFPKAIEIEKTYILNNDFLKDFTDIKKISDYWINSRCSGKN